MKKIWTPQEIEELRRLYPTASASALASRFATSAGAVRCKCFRLGLRKGLGHARIRLCGEDRLWLRLNFPHMRNELCAMRLGVSLRTVSRLARSMGLEKTPQFMKESQAFAARKARESNLRNGTFPPKGVIPPGLRKGAAYRFAKGHGLKWTPDLDDRLRALYPSHTAAAIAKTLGMTRCAVANRVHTLGLRKSRKASAAKTTQSNEP